MRVARLAAAGLLLVAAAAGRPFPAVAAPAAPPVAFEGNRALASRRLRQAAADELERFRRLGGRRADADDAAYRMTLAYRREGFAFAEIDYRVGTDGRPGVVFTVREGPRVLLGEVSIEGAATFEAARLREFLPGAAGLLPGAAKRTPFVADEVRAGVREIGDFYRSEGFLDVRIEGPSVAFSPERTRADVGVTVREGPRYRIREVEVAGAPAAAAAELERMTRALTGAVYTPMVEPTLQARIVELHGDLGYPDAVVRVESAALGRPGEVRLSVAIDPGPLVEISEVLVTGNARTRRSFILERLPLAPGDRYSLQSARAAVRELYNSGLFSRVDVRLDPGADGGERPLLVEVEEVPARQLSFGIGWSSYELLRAGAGVRHANLFGTGRAAGLEGNLSAKRSGVTADLTDPRFLGTPFAASLPVAYRRDVEPSYTKELVQIAPQLSHQLTKHLSATVRYPLQYASTTATSPEAPAELAAGDYRLASLGFQVRYDTRRGLFFPAGGLEATLSGDAADPAVGSQLNFLRLVGTLRGYRALGVSTVLAARVESGIALPTHGEADLPLGERFFLGGERSVRSFGEAGLGPRDAAGEPVGGLGYNLLSLELRQRLRGNLSGALFADAGTVSPNRSFPGLVESSAAGTLGDREVIDATLRDYLRDFRAGVGFGLRYLLPIGPARLDLAWNPDPREQEDSFRAHLSVGMAF